MEIPRHWRLKKQRYSLVGDICPHCDEKHFPPQRVCADCGSDLRKNTITNTKKAAAPDQSAMITCPTYNGEANSYLFREVEPYSKMLKAEEDQNNAVEGGVPFAINIRVPSGVIYQDSGVAV